MKIIACYNIKGGVGKTTTVVNLAYLAAAQGWRCLIWDLDPQAAASFYFRIKPKVKQGLQGLLKRKTSLADIIKATDYANLDIIPADISYRKMELLLADRKKPKQQLHKLLRPFDTEYDYIFLDCPPGSSLVSASVLHAVDVLLVPVIPTILSLRTLEQLLKFSKSQQLSPLCIMPFYSMVDRRKNLHRIMLKNPPKKGPVFLDACIPYSSEVEQMGVHRAPLASYAGKSRNVMAYRSLLVEMDKRMRDKKSADAVKLF